MKKIFAFAIAVSCLLTLAACGTEAEIVVPAATSTPMPTATPIPAPTASPTPVPTPEPPPVPEAKELTDSLILSDSIGGATDYLLYDPDVETHIDYREGNTLRIEAPEAIGSLYFIWYTPPEAYDMDLGGVSQTGGADGYLQEYIVLDTPAESLTLSFRGHAPLAQIRAFGVGTPSDDIHVWKAPCERADVLVFPTHADDDVIFFGALIASCVDRGLAVQVAYLTEHYDWQPRPQEQLNALWALGVRNYPVLGSFPDYYVLSAEEAYASFDFDAVVARQTELIRRFRPSVVFGHDRYGEYGHGAHILCSDAVESAVFAAGDANACPDSAARWGTWDVPKLYLHFADENPIWIDVLSPLEAFGGITAFDAAQEAMLCHESQLQYPHRPQLENEDFPRYDCRAFGLVRSLVGEDTGNDFMEHIG